MEDVSYFEKFVNRGKELGIYLVFFLGWIIR